MTTLHQDYWQEDIHVNRAQYAYLMLQAKNKYAIMSRGTGKSFIVGAEVDENVRIMPRGITTIAQATIGQALTKTLPSTFKMLEMLGYKPYDYETHTGDYVVAHRRLRSLQAASGVVYPAVRAHYAVRSCYFV